MPARKDLSLKSLEMFEISARHPSLQSAADAAGLSVSTMSHHLHVLENHLGVPLFDHSRRPMVLTATGQSFLRNIEPALIALRAATAEAASGEPATARHLRLGSIEDFDSDIIPGLAVHLSRRMPQCDFTYHSDASRAIVEMLRKRELDIGLVATPQDRPEGLSCHPVLRDPFVMVMPAQSTLAPEDLVRGETDLPFLRFTTGQIIAQQIEAQLKRMKYTLPNRFECGNNQTLMAMVSVGAGWTITTPLLFARARQFHSHLKMQPFPGRAFARELSLISTPDCANSVRGIIEGKLRQMLADHAILPVLEKAPWLADSFRLLGGISDPAELDETEETES